MLWEGGWLSKQRLWEKLGDLYLGVMREWGWGAEFMLVFIQPRFIDFLGAFDIVWSLDVKLRRTGIGSTGRVSGR